MAYLSVAEVARTNLHMSKAVKWRNVDIASAFRIIPVYADFSSLWECSGGIDCKLINNPLWFVLLSIIFQCRCWCYGSDHPIPKGGRCRYGMPPNQIYLCLIVHQHGYKKTGAVADKSEEKKTWYVQLEDSRMFLWVTPLFGASKDSWERLHEDLCSVLTMADYWCIRDVLSSANWETFRSEELGQVDIMPLST